jgi:predicted permease
MDTWRLRLGLNDGANVHGMFTSDQIIQLVIIAVAGVTIEDFLNIKKREAFSKISLLLKVVSSPALLVNILNSYLH